MGTSTKLFAFSVAALAVFAYVKVKPIFDIPEKPVLVERWWKASKPGKVDTSIRPFKIHISDEVLEDLKYRLNKTLPFQKSLVGVKQHYGMNDKVLNAILDHWKTKYDWRQREEFLNRYPQFITNIQGLDIHFIHVKPQKKQGIKVLPLLLFHGWPTSMRELYEIIPLLTTPREGQDFVFEIVVPGFPGFGFSEAAEVPGLGSLQVAAICRDLMTRLGYEKYYIQGGNWGDIMLNIMATLFPEKIIGAHTNLCVFVTPTSNLKLLIGSFFPSLIADKGYEHLVFPLSNLFQYLMEELGYMHLQSTKPDTIGVALRESPMGLAAYILEKFTTWTNRAWKDLDDGGLTKKYTMEALIDNVMLYWVNRSIMTAIRLYSETFNSEIINVQAQIDKIPIDVPSACARFTWDIVFMPESIVKEKYRNLIQISTYEGGNMATFEEPELLAEDFIEFVKKVEKLPKS